MAEGDGGRFAFPAEHQFPPFYTLQPNVQTASVQVDMWAQLVLAYCAHESRFWLDAAGAWERTSPLFCNRDLDRALSPAMIRIVLAHLVKQKHAIYHPQLPRGVRAPELDTIVPNRSTQALSVSTASRPALSSPEEAACNVVLVLWRSPEAWGDALYQWVCRRIAHTDLRHGTKQEHPDATRARPGRLSRAAPSAARAPPHGPPDAGAQGARAGLLSHGRSVGIALESRPAGTGDGRVNGAVGRQVCIDGYESLLYVVCESMHNARKLVLRFFLFFLFFSEMFHSALLIILNFLFVI